jgi:hypothetical protein
VVGLVNLLYAAVLVATEARSRDEGPFDLFQSISGYGQLDCTKICGGRRAAGRSGGSGNSCLVGRHQVLVRSKVRMVPAPFKLEISICVC